MATESFGKILKAAKGWGERAVWEAARNPKLKGDRPDPQPLYDPTEDDIRKFREIYGIKK